MAIHAYLKPESVPTARQLGLDVIKPVSHPFISLAGDPVLPGSIVISPEAEALVLRYSFQTEFYGGGSKTRREPGVYRLKTAVASVEFTESGKQALKVIAPRLADAVELNVQVRLGNIKPLPGDSFEDGQEERIHRLLTIPELKVKILTTMDEIVTVFKAWLERVTKQTAPEI